MIAIVDKGIQDLLPKELCAVITGCSVPALDVYDIFNSFSHWIISSFQTESINYLLHTEWLCKWTAVEVCENRAVLSHKQRRTAGVCTESSSLGAAERPDRASFAFTSSQLIVTAALQRETDQLTHSHPHAN